MWLFDLSEIIRPRRPRSAPVRSMVRLAVESLEAREVPATFIVQNLSNSGPGSLRQAVLDANFLPGGDATGGGFFNDATSALTLLQSWVIRNRAESGDGLSLGGGVFNLGLIDVGAGTVIAGNHADDFDDCFGC